MDATQFEALLGSTELRLRRLRTLYDQYFQGIERAEPTIERTEIDRALDQMRRSQPRNTALRFRFNQLVQRFTTYTAYWKRIRRQIEEGTYQRDVLRARRRFGDNSRQVKPGLELDIDIEAAMDSLDSLPVSAPPPEPIASAPAPLAPSLRVERPAPASSRKLPVPTAAVPTAAVPTGAVPTAAVPTAAIPTVAVSRAPASKAVPRFPAPSVAAPPAAVVASRASAPTAAGPDTGISEAQIQALYQRYIDARRNNQERTDNVKFETIAKTVRDMMPKLAEKHAGKRIAFDVVLKDGRVALKPVAK